VSSLTKDSRRAFFLCRKPKSSKKSSWLAFCVSMFKFIIYLQ
jgi:hypothetical protein